jgi:hypothetical protein
MMQTFTPITRNPLPTGDGYVWERASYPTRPVSTQDVPHDGPFQPSTADEFVHYGAVTLFRGPAADFLDVSDTRTRAHLLWTTTWLGTARELERDLANLLQLIAIDTYNATIALVSMGELDRAKGQLVFFRDAIQGWAMALNRHDLPSELRERVAIANAYIERQPDTLSREFYRLHDYLDARID